jgi:hypothetical protein
MTFLAKGSRMKNAFLLRTPSRNSAIVLLRDTLAVVHIELHTPLSQEDFVKAQTVHAMAPLPVDVELGQYDMDRTRFSDCTMSAEFQAADYRRVDYLSWRRKRT